MNYEKKQGEESFNYRDIQPVHELFQEDPLDIIFQMDEFWIYLIRNITNFAIYYKKQRQMINAMQYFSIGYKIAQRLNYADRISEIEKKSYRVKHVDDKFNCANPNLQQACANHMLQCGLYYMEKMKYETSLQLLKLTLDHLQSELQIRSNLKVKLRNKNLRREISKYDNCLRVIVLTLQS